MPKPQKIEIWHGPLPRLPAALLERMLPILSADERARLARFADPRDAFAYGVAHGMLRELLAGWTGRRPGELPIVSEPQARPVLADSLDIGFSLSRRRAGILVAAARGTALGVDIEEVSAAGALTGIGAAFGGGLPAGEAGIRAWALIEAWLKARGTGLTIPLPALRFSPIDEPADAGRCRAARWRPDAATAAAIVADTRAPIDLHLHEWMGPGELRPCPAPVEQGWAHERAPRPDL